MDLFDFGQITDFLRFGGHEYLQSALLFMIWWTSRGIRRDLSVYKKTTDTRLDVHEKRITILEDKLLKI